MKGFISGIGIGAAASATGVAGYLGFQQLIQVDQSRTAGEFQPREFEFTETTPSPTVQKTSTQRIATAALISQPERIEATKSVSFGSLSYCGQLDAIARGGKSVSAFIAASADKGGYLWAVRSRCNWHSSQAAQVSKPATSETPFQTLSYCDQLDALDRSGKSVSQFILNSADSKGYIWAAKSKCSWHREQANVASLTLNPPVVRGTPATVEPRRAVQEASYFRRV